MGGDGPRNGRTRAALPHDASPDLFDLIGRRTRGLLAGAVAEGWLPAELDLGRFGVAPPRPGLSGDALVDAGLVYGPDAGPHAARLVSALADGLRGAPEVEAVAVAPAGLLVVTFRREAVFDGVRAVLLRRPADAPQPGTDLPGHDAGSERAGTALAKARAEVAAEIEAALAAAAGPAGPWVRRGAEGRRSPEAGASRPPRGRPHVLVRGGPRGASPAGLDAREVLTWIGVDAFRFAVASCRADAALHLDLDVLGDRCRADPSFWVRYAHARARALLRRAATFAPGAGLRPADLAAADFSRLPDGGAMGLARLVARQASAVAGGSPRGLAAYLVLVADAVHLQWSASKEQPQLRFVNEELREMAEARLGLVTAAALVLRSGLGIIGIAAPDEMP